MRLAVQLKENQLQWGLMNQPNITRPSPFSWGLGMRLNVSEKDLYGMIDHIMINIIHLEHFTIKVFASEGTIL